MASFRMPDESEQHAATWMVLKASKAIWGGDLAPYVEKDLVKIAKTIAKYEAATWALLTLFSVHISLPYPPLGSTFFLDPKP